MQKETIVSIINDGVTAPSGENCQPWRFKVSGEELFVYNVPEADTSLYNLDQRGSYLAHGALLETISISAKHHGYNALVTLFPEGETSLIARIGFAKIDDSDSELYEYIRKRSTNRKEYHEYHIKDDTKEQLKNETRFSSLVLLDDKEVRQTLGESLAFHEKVLFENRYLHDFFYDHIIWDKEDENKSGGFFVDTLEFLPHQLKGVKLFKNWNVLAVLNRILKVSTMISKENAAKYAKAGAIVGFIFQGNSPESYVRLGMDMQRVWLRATECGLAVHPCNGTLYLADYIKSTGGKEFSPLHKEGIFHAAKTIASLFTQEEVNIGFVFRIGKASSPSAVSKRLPPVIEYE